MKIITSNTILTEIVDKIHSQVPSLTPLFIGTYNLKTAGSVGESFAKYSITNAKNNGVDDIENAYFTYSQIYSFQLENNVPNDYTYYFGFMSQRIGSYPGVSLLNEYVFLNILQEEKNIGYVYAQKTYPDRGSNDVSSVGVEDYYVYISSGILEQVQIVQIEFFPDLSRIVRFF
jgi:hypothetical protein